MYFIIVLLHRVGTVSRAAEEHVHDEGEGKLSEAGI